MFGITLGANGKNPEIGLEAFRNVLKAFRTANTSSLLDVTKPARVEPTAMVDAALAHNEDLPQLMQTHLAIFSGTYLQAVALSMNVGAVNTLKTLDKLNPRRDAIDAALMPESDWLLAEESYQYGLPRYSMESQRVTNENDFVVMPLCLSFEAKDKPHPQSGNDAQVTGQPIPTVRRAPAVHGSVAENTGTHASQPSGEPDAIPTNDPGRDPTASAAYQQRERHHQDKMEQSHSAHADRLDFQRAQHADSLKSRAAEQTNKEKDHDLRRADQAHRHALDEKRLKQTDQHHQDKMIAEEKRGKKSGAEHLTIKDDALRTVRERNDLSIGKLLSVEVSDGANSRSVLVAVRLIVAVLPTKAILHAFSGAYRDISFHARWHGWRSGRLEFWKDLIWMQDLIDAHRDHLIADKDGLFTSLVNVKRQNQLAALLSGRLSVATASNILIISQETADMIEFEARISIAKYEQRQKLFEPTSLMIMTIVNERTGWVKMYYRGIPDGSSFSIRDLKSSNKSNGPDIAEIMRAMQMGSAPRI